MAAHTPTELVLAAIWSDVLRVGQIGADDCFFALGGHSLLATKVLSQIARQLSMAVGIDVMFQRRTIAAMAAYIDEINFVREIATQVNEPVVGFTRKRI